MNQSVRLPPISGSQTLGEIAAALPGATAVFRRHGLDFCCGGDASLTDACAGAGLEVDDLAAELAKAAPADAAPPTDPDSLIDHILERYHAVHRRELPELVALAETVENVHAGHAAVPKGLAVLLDRTADELAAHMDKEEGVLFPMMRRGGHPMISQPIAMMRHEHDSHGETLRTLERMTNGFRIPEGACGTWRALYVGLDKLAGDLMTHIHLENNILFPRFAG